ncbi:putative prophage tail fiber protein [Shigella sonnei]|nr:putative prophage tail fiber protein [Shigella sonnei]
MSVVISGALTDGAGIPMSGCQIILKSRVNTSEVVMRTRADVVTGNNGEYSFEAQVGKYCVYLKRDWRDEYCVGDIAVYDDSKPGTLNDFLIAPDGQTTETLMPVTSSEMVACRMCGMVMKCITPPAVTPFRGHFAHLRDTGCQGYRYRIPAVTQRITSTACITDRCKN